MRIHHLNCGTDCPLGGRLFDGVSPGLFGRLVCAVQLIETDAGLVLVDTGYGVRDVAEPRSRVSGAFRTLLNIRFRLEETALHQVKALGFKAEDVRHIVLTHLDFDHAGGLDDFPHARVHLMGVEAGAAQRRRGPLARRRYRPAQFDGVGDWRTYGAQGEPWMGFEAVRELDGLPPEILMVPLRGHTAGHAGVAVDTGAGWILNAGDAYFHRHEMDVERPRCTPGLAAYQRLMEVDRGARLANQARLRALKAQAGVQVRIFCSHDPVEFDAGRGGTV